jgi:hypothetical protein
VYQLGRRISTGCMSFRAPCTLICLFKAFLHLDSDMSMTSAMPLPSLHSQESSYFRWHSSIVRLRRRIISGTLILKISVEVCKATARLLLRRTKYRSFRVDDDHAGSSSHRRNGYDCIGGRNTCQIFLYRDGVDILKKDSQSACPGWKSRSLSELTISRPVRA